MIYNVETKNRVFGAFGRLVSLTKNAGKMFLKTIPAVFVAAAVMQVSPAMAGQIKALKIYHVHTHEKATIVFKRNGRYDTEGLKKLNYILRDWRENEPTRMDPRLFDLIWEVYQKSGSNDYINVICGYRAPETNAMLRSRTRGVAEKSQHILGKAMDFYIPDVSLRKLREIGIKFQVGGVGFYPTSGSPFVHMDVGGVRAWPRMPRRELARLFPDGKTLHKPAEGGVMPGYAAALADYRRRVSSDSIMVAGGPSSNSDRDSGRHKSLLAALFSSSNDDSEDDSVEAADAGEVSASPRGKATIVQSSRKQPVVMTAAADDSQINAPVPVVRPSTGDDQAAIETALLSTQKNPAEEAMKAALTPNGDQTGQMQPEFVNLASRQVPVPQLLGERKRPGDAEDNMLTASLDPGAEAQISAVPLPAERPEDIKTASADPDSIDAPENGIRPEEIAALAAETGSSVKDATTDEDEAADIADTLDNADKPAARNKLQELASLDVAPVSQTRAINLPEGVRMPADNTGGKVVKGGRPHVGATGAKAGGKLTQNLIAQWALANGRSDFVNKSVKAPRFASSTMRATPTEVYADGFTTHTAEIDPARFAGTAVNFIPVKKFDGNAN